MTQPEMISKRFSLEDAVDIIRPFFARVEEHTLPGTLRLPSFQSFVNYFASSRALTTRSDHTKAEWQAVLDYVWAETEAVIAGHGHFDVTKITGALVGTKGH